jgi:hypothetical protein
MILAKTQLSLALYLIKRLQNSPFIFLDLKE